MQRTQRITVVGAGLMGHAIALEFALNGFEVRVYDTRAEALADLRDRARQTAAPLVQIGLVAAPDLEAGLARLHPTADLAATCADAEYLVEAVSEDLALKQQLYRELDRLCPPGTIFASNTSSLPPSELGAATSRPDRVLVAHYFNPPHLIPVVEIVLGRETSQATADATAALLRRIGKTPALVKREVVGFVANRLQAALLREALALVEQGVADVESVDAIVRLGFGRRLAVFGPFAIADLAGLDVWAAIARVIFPTLDTTPTPPPLLAERVAQGQYGAKTGAGFYPWPTDRLQAALAERDAELLHRLAADRRRSE